MSNNPFPIISKLLLIFLSFMVGSIGCSSETILHEDILEETAIYSQELKSSGTVASDLPEMLTPQPQEQDWAEYVNPTVGFLLQIPSDWYAIPPSQSIDWQTSVFANFDLLSSPPTEGEGFVESDQIKIEVGLHPHQIQPGESLEAWAGEHFWDIPSNNPVSEIRNGSTKGIQTILTPEAGNALLLLLFDKGIDVIYVIAGPYSAENAERINNVLSSIEFD